MRKSQKIQLKQSETRQKLNDLLGKDELSDEERESLESLTKTAQDLEVEYRAAVEAEDDGSDETRARDEGDAEDRERRELRQKIEFSNYVAAAAEKRAANGAEGEFNAAYGIGAHRFPLELLAPAPVEERATTDVDTAVRPQRWLDRLFAVSAAARVGITFATVEPGVVSYPIMLTGGAGAQKARTQADAADSWTIGSTELKGTRHSIHRVFSREDDLRNPGLQEQLTNDLRMALADSLDLAVFEGDATATGTEADITGLNTAANVVERTLTQTNKVKPAETLAEFFALIDGKHAESAGDLRIVSSVGANTLWGTTIANAAAENQTLAQFLMASGLSWSTRGDLEETTGAGKFGAFMGRARGLDGAGVAPVWQDAMLIVDPYSGAAKAEIELTLMTFWNLGFVRASNFARLKFVA